MPKAKCNFLILTAFFLILIFLHGGKCDAFAKNPFYINLQIDAESNDAYGLNNIINELTRRNIKATIYATAEYVNKNPDLIDDIHEKGFEIALHGNSTVKQLSTMKYAEQKNLLKSAKDILEGCRPCGFFKSIIGFRFQPFSQNENTFRVLDELGIVYISGIKIGKSNKKIDELPVLLEGHGFYVIPVTSVLYDERLIYLNDSDPFLNKKLELKPGEWSEVLSLSVKQSVRNNSPLVLILHDWYTGGMEKYGYWKPFVEFLDQVEHKATFIKTHEIVTKKLY